MRESSVPPPHQNGHRKGWWSRLFGRKEEDTRAHAYRRLAIQLRFDLGESEHGLCLMLTSPSSSTDSSAHVALELARFLASEEGKHVLVVDGHFRDARTTNLLEAGSSPGFLNHLGPTTSDLSSILLGTDHERVAFLARGQARNGTTSLDPEEVETFLSRARRQFDYVLIPCAPVLEDSISLVLPALVDCVLLLSVEGETRVQDLDASQAALASCNARRVGHVLTAPRGRRR